MKTHSATTHTNTQPHTKTQSATHQHTTTHEDTQCHTATHTTPRQNTPQPTHTTTHNKKQAAPPNVLNALLANTRPDVLQRLRPILPESRTRGRVAQETYSPTFEPVPQGNEVPGTPPPAGGSDNTPPASGGEPSPASDGVAFNTVPGSPPIGGTPLPSPGFSPLSPSNTNDGTLGVCSSQVVCVVQ